MPRNEYDSTTTKIFNTSFAFIELLFSNKNNNKVTNFYFFWSVNKKKTKFSLPCVLSQHTIKYLTKTPILGLLITRIALYFSLFNSDLRIYL